MTFAKICFTFIACIPLTVAAYLFLRNLVEEIDKKKESHR